MPGQRVLHLPGSPVQGLRVASWTKSMTLKETLNTFFTEKERLSHPKGLSNRIKVVACEPDTVARIGKSTTIFCELGTKMRSILLEPPKKRPRVLADPMQERTSCIYCLSTYRVSWTDKILSYQIRGAILKQSKPLIFVRCSFARWEFLSPLGVGQK